jgi:hypothetical protein
MCKNLSICAANYLIHILLSNILFILYTDNKFNCGKKKLAAIILRKQKECLVFANSVCGDYLYQSHYYILHPSNIFY